MSNPSKSPFSSAAQEMDKRPRRKTGGKVPGYKNAGRADRKGRSFGPVMLRGVESDPGHLMGPVDLT
jgi:hypothetical protein